MLKCILSISLSVCVTLIFLICVRPLIIIDLIFDQGYQSTLKSGKWFYTIRWFWLNKKKVIFERTVIWSVGICYMLLPKSIWNYKHLSLKHANCWVCLKIGHKLVVTMFLLLSKILFLYLFIHLFISCRSFYTLKIK